MTKDLVKSYKRGRAFYIQLCRPRKKNAITDEVIEILFFRFREKS